MHRERFTQKARRETQIVLPAVLIILFIVFISLQNTNLSTALLVELTRDFFESHPARPRSVATAALLGPVSYTVFV